VDELKAAWADEAAPTIRTERKVNIDFTQATIASGDKSYPFAPLGEVAQELIVKGGFEAVIKERLDA